MNAHVYGSVVKTHHERVVEKQRASFDRYKKNGEEPLRLRCQILQMSILDASGSDCGFL